MAQPHLLLLVLIALAGPSLAQQAQRVPEKSPAREAKARNQAERQQYPSESAPLPIRVIESPSDEAYRKRREADTAKHENADLKTQERSASAAEQQVSVGTAVAWLSGLGFLALIWTLCETRRTANAAVRSATVARAALTLARSTGKMELRAYINVFEVGAIWPEHPDKDLRTREVTVTVKTRNFGATPAHNVRSWADAESLPSDKTFDLETFLPSNAGKGVEAPQQVASFVLKRFAVVDNDKIPEWEREKETMYVWGVIEYDDAFGKEHATRFRYFMPRDGMGPTSGRFKACADGNIAT